MPSGLTGLIPLLSKGTLKSLLQHHSLKASVLQCSVFFVVKLSHLYLTTGKTIALTRWTFVGKVASLLFNMLSRFGSVQFSSVTQSCLTLCNPVNHSTPALPVHSRLVIAFLPRSKWFLISWLQSPYAVILEPEKIKSLTVSPVSPSIAMKR